MDNWQKYIWALPIVGAIFAFLSIATPALVWSLGGLNVDAWMIGYWDGGVLGDGWVDEIYEISGGIGPDIGLAIFIVSFVFVLLSGIMALGVGVLGYRGDFDKKYAALSGAIMIIITIIFLAVIESEWEVFSTWEMDPGFGVIGPFIGGAFCIASFFAPQLGERITSVQPRVTAQPQAKPTSEARFCSDCGTEVPGDFCPDCGKPFQPVIAQ